jgi:RNA polymerase sigma-70 factor (ECF subfamily)
LRYGVNRREFDEIILPLYNPLQRRLLMIVRDQDVAADLTQEAFVNAWRAWHSFDGRQPRAWLFQIGVRLALNYLRRQAVWNRVRQQLRPQPEVIPSVEPDLWQALGALRPKERTALLFSVDGYTYREIAGLLGVSSGTVGSLIARARAQLRAAMEMQ